MENRVCESYTPFGFTLNATWHKPALGIMALLPVYIQFLMQSDSVRTNETMIFEDEPGWKVLSLPSKTTDIYGENGRNWDGNDRTQTLVTLWNVNDLAGIKWKIRRNRQMKRRENVQEVVVSNANHDKTKHKPLHEIETAILHEIHTNRHTIGGFYKRWALTFDSVRLTESAICWRCLCEIIIATTKQIWRPSSSHMQQQSREWLETKEKIVSSNLCLRLNSLSVDYSAILWRRFPVSHSRRIDKLKSSDFELRHYLSGRKFVSFFINIEIV